MEKIELLSPVGDVKNFYVAIQSGADAVYLGLPKFNARMRAENISADNLHELVTFAHLKNVKVYVVINILLTDNEISQMCDMVHMCMNAYVDAFIVQDYGVIGVLKEMFPDIVLHGSTQLGVHNLRGARVAKDMGLSRVVLSREVTLKDIAEITSGCDIELEVFVQGAMCVSFSGNCYMSSLKCGASGNRGECKQLCRLPYTLSDGKSSSNGYMISPRDNCMIDYLDKLISLGVKSLKIEGRLRNENYVRVATGIYRQAIDEVYNNGCVLSPKDKINLLAEVFSRGDYICGYFEGNDIINSRENNHLGKEIGRVISCNKFKDIYKIAISTKEKINTHDGIKFIYNGEIVSMGVGNFDISGNNVILYGNKYIHCDSKVYLSKSNNSNVCDYGTHRSLHLIFTGNVGDNCSLEIKCEDISVKVTGDIISKGEKKITDKDTIISQLSKVNKDIFQIVSYDITIDEGYIPLSVINNLRRQAIDELTSKICFVKKINTKKELLDIKFPCLFSKYTKVAIVDEAYDFSEKYDALILSPNVYDLSVIKKFKDKYNKYYDVPLIINLPIIALYEDMKIIDEIVKCNRECEFVANNIYALDYLKDGVTVWAGSGLNITNSYTCKYLYDMGVSQFISSIEKWAPTINGTYKITSGHMPLMTLAHCPVKTLYKNNCAECRYTNDMMLTSHVGYKIKRYKIHNCYFKLIDNVNINYNYSNCICDLRKF